MRCLGRHGPAGRSPDLTPWSAEPGSVSDSALVHRSITPPRLLNREFRAKIRTAFLRERIPDGPHGSILGLRSVLQSTLHSAQSIAGGARFAACSIPMGSRGARCTAIQSASSFPPPLFVRLLLGVPVLRARSVNERGTRGDLTPLIPVGYDRSQPHGTRRE